MGNRAATGQSDEDPQRYIFSLEDIKRITQTLVAFLKNTKAHCVLLVDKEGHLLTMEGKYSSYDADTVCALAVATFASVRDTALLLGDEKFSVLFHQGERANLQLTRVGPRTMLAVIFEGIEGLGMIRLYAGQVSGKLAGLFNDIAQRGRGGRDPSVDP